MINCTFENGNKASLRHVIVDALVLKGNQILMVKRVGKLLEGGKWAIVGGFVDRDETCQQAVVREIREETGYEVSDVKLLKINDNPDRPHEDRQNVAFVYVCKAGDKEGEGDWESDEVKWFDLDKLPPKEEVAFDHFEDIEFYLKHKK